MLRFMSGFVAAVALLVTAGLGGSATGAATGLQAPEDPVRWEAFSYDDLLERRRASDRPYLPFLNVPTLSTGLYVLPASGDDRQQPHQRDEVYYIVAGRAVLEVDGERRPVSPGDVIFVKAEVDHRFVEITDELQVVVFFAGPSQ